MKKTYYISVAEGSISKVKEGNTGSFTITASDEEVLALRQLLDQANTEDIRSFIRAHIPFMEYHNDAANHAYDNYIQNVYKMIYELGDKETRDSIMSMGVLDGTRY